MITPHQIRAARALLCIDQKQLAALAGLSLPTIQRVEASGGQVRSVVNTLTKVVSALEQAGIEIIEDDAPSTGIGCGVRFRENSKARASDHHDTLSSIPPRREPPLPPTNER